MSDDPDGEYRDACAALEVALDRCIESWVGREVEARIPDDWDSDRRLRLAAASGAVAADVREAVARDLGALFALDVEAQHASPIGVLRKHLGPVNVVLAEAGVDRPHRDAFDESREPADVYGLSPANFADVDPALAELGIRWGAAKAHVVLRRHHDL